MWGTKYIFELDGEVASINQKSSNFDVGELGVVTKIFKIVLQPCTIQV